MDDDFNSSDVDLGPPPRSRYANAGKASIERLIENASEFRLSSKKRVKELTFGHGAETTRRSQYLWVNRFEAFRRHSLKQDLGVPFTGDDLIRFLDSILYTKLARLPGKPGPNDDLAWLASKYILQYGAFTWSAAQGFSHTTHDNARLKNFISNAVRDGRLTAGHWQKSTWIGFVTLSRMVRAYLLDAHAKGVASWDVVISRCLSVVLISALGCRSGDVAQSRGYAGNEYLQHQHVELYLESVDNDNNYEDNGRGDAITLAHVRATITIHYAKGLKNKRGDNLVKHLTPLLDPSCHHMCPITLLFIHALRHGMLQGGNSLPEVLRYAAQRSDKRIIWTHPQLPILAAFSDGSTQCKLDHPAKTNQILDSIKKMDLAAGVLDRVYAHRLRLGAARDMSHLPASSLATHNEVGHFMGHNETSLAQGVTRRYIGDSSADHYTARATAKVVHLREPKFAFQPESVVTYVRGKVTDTEREKAAAASVAAETHQNVAIVRGQMSEQPAPLPSLRASRLTNQVLDNRVRKERAEELRDTMMGEPRRSHLRNAAAEQPSPLPPPPTTPAPLGTSDSRTPFRRPTPLTERSINTRYTMNSGMKLINDDQSSSSTSNYASNMDSVLMTERNGLDDFSEMPPTDEVPEQQLTALSLAIFPQAEGCGIFPVAIHNLGTAAPPLPNTDHDELEAAQLLLGAETAGNVNRDEFRQAGVGRECDSASRFADSYARYNIVRNQAFALQWGRYDAEEQGSFDETIGMYSNRGHSRDEPTPFMMSCQVTPGCRYQSIYQEKVTRHEENCTPAKQKSKEAALILKQNVMDAAAQASDPDSGDGPADVVNASRRCPEPGCNFVLAITDETKVKYQMKAHIKSVHSFVARLCEHNGCHPEKLFQTLTAYQTHQRVHHSGRWPTRCRVPDCDDEEKEFANDSSYNLHLRKAHGLHDSKERLQYHPPKLQKGKFAPQTCIISDCDNEYVFKKPVDLKKHLVSDHNLDVGAAKELIKQKAMYAANKQPDQQYRASVRRQLSTPRRSRIRGRELVEA